MFVGIGGAFFLGWLCAEQTAKRLIGAALLIGMAETVVSLGLQGLDLLGLPWSAIGSAVSWRAALGTSLAPSLAAALIGLLLAGTTLGRMGPRPGRVVSALALVCVGATLALSGHASTASPEWMTRPAIFLHGLCVAFWIGALLPLLIMTMRRSPDLRVTLARFSDIAIPLVGLLILTGGTMATIQMETPSAFLTTPYGRILGAKLVLIAILLILAAFNRVRFAKKGEASVRPLKRSIAAESVLALLIFGLVAGWRFTTPPRALAAVPHTASFELQSQNGMASATVSPARVGANTFEFTLMDASMQAMLPKDMTLTLSLASAGIEPLTRQATRNASGLWVVDNVILPQPGRWHAQLEALVSDFDETTMETDVPIAQ